MWQFDNKVIIIALLLSSVECDRNTGHTSVNAILRDALGIEHSRVLMITRKIPVRF